MPKPLLIVGPVGVLCACRARQDFTNRAFWQSDPDDDASAALAQGDSQFILLTLPDSGTIVFRISINLELNTDRDLRTVTADSIGMDGAYFDAHREGIYQYLDKYNARMLDAHLAEAMR